MPAGRPPKYSTAEEMQSVIDGYFQTDAFIGEGDKRVFAPTVAGLAYALDLSRQGLLEYEDKGEFSDTVKKAKQRIAIALEQKLYGQTVTGIIFNLKNNFGWKDQSQQELTGANGGPLEIHAIERTITRAQ